MVISWILSSVDESIRKSVLFINLSHEIWTQLEERFSMSNGLRKYKLNKEVYALMQNGANISDHYTKMKSLWEEIDCMNELPRIEVVTAEITSFMKALNKQEEQKLFQFLNGLDATYNTTRSQLLIMSPLPSVETACSLLQLEESQREVLDVSKVEVEMSAMYSKE